MVLRDCTTGCGTDGALHSSSLEPRHPVRHAEAAVLLLEGNVVEVQRLVCRGHGGRQRGEDAGVEAPGEEDTHRGMETLLPPGGGQTDAVLAEAGLVPQPRRHGCGEHLLKLVHNCGYFGIL